MSLGITRAADWSAEALAACFTAAFDGYLAGSFVMTPAVLPQRLARWGSELALSRCVVRDGALMGFVFIGKHAGRRRVGAMGLRPEVRGSGASRLLLRTAVDEARQAGADALDLEVFAQNTPALRLYRSFGFVEGPALWGFVREPGGVMAGTPIAPRTVNIAGAADWLAVHGLDDMPYQVGAESLRHVDAGARAWQIGTALIVFNETPDGSLVMPLLFDADPAQHDASRLLHALLAAFPRHTVRVPQLMRDDVAGRALREAGFTPLPLHQLQMRLPLTS